MLPTSLELSALKNWLSDEPLAFITNDDEDGLIVLMANLPYNLSRAS
jgi:hypothetical protein